MDALQRRDYPVVQGGVLLVAIMIILVNLLVDVLYGVVNPRIRHKKQAQRSSQITESTVKSAPKPMTPLQEFWHYFKRNKGAVIGLFYIIIARDCRRCYLACPARPGRAMCRWCVTETAVFEEVQLEIPAGYR